MIVRLVTPCQTQFLETKPTQRDGLNRLKCLGICEGDKVHVLIFKVAHRVKLAYELKRKT